tara:strand:- start:268 stop:2679 length:2412 start_codon:yes stop_codon:yes gene_type:complete
MKKKILFMMALALGIQFVSAQAINNTDILLYLDFEDDIVDNSPATNFSFARKISGNASGAGGNEITYDDTNGKFGKYAVLDNTVYESSNSVFNTSNSSTLAVWVRVDDTEVISGSTAISHVLDMANGPAAGTSDDGTSQLRLRTVPPGGGINSFSSATTASEQYTNTLVTKEVWYHIAIVHDAINETQTFYINGVEDFIYDYSAIATKPRNAQTDLIIGANKVGNTGQALQGDIDDLLITSELLTLSQVQSLMNFGVEASRNGITSVWTGNGDTDTAFGTPANWLPSGAPAATGNIMIPSGLTNYPIASADFTVANIIVEKNASLNAGANSITSNSSIVNGGGSLIANSVSGTFTYNVLTAIDNSAPPQIANPEGAGNIFNPAVWNLMSSPVIGETYDNDWILFNFIGTGTGANRAIASYNNTNGNWDYFQASVTPETFEQGVGFSTRKKTVDYQSKDIEVYEFVGTFPNSDVTVSITQGATNNWNLVGNPYPSYIRVSELLAATNGGGTNADNITTANKTVYVWNGATYTGLATTDYIQPGQGFFVSANNSTASNFSIPNSLQSHQTGVTFYKNANTKITLSISEGDKVSNAFINYASDKTLGLDSGNDIGMFTGVASSFALYTHLVGNDKGIAFERQALPNSDFESMIIPVGVIASAGKEISFSIDAQNLPSGINTYLEDKVAKTFTLLENGTNYKVALNAKQDGIGRFYLHTRSAALSTDDVLLDAVRIFKINNATVRISGLNNGKATFKMFTILGKQLLNTSFTANGNKDISLPNLATGIYLIQLETEQGNISKKIILE